MKQQVLDYGVPARRKFPWGGVAIWLFVVMFWLAWLMLMLVPELCLSSA